MSREVVILIPHFNDPKGLERTIASISKDEICDVLIVDDGSQEIFNERVLENSFKSQGQIHFLYLEQNRGIETALNKGLNWAKDKGYIFIARLDCGDTNLPNRISKQVRFLKTNSDIQLLGTWAEAVNIKGTPLYQLHLPIQHEQIKNKMFLNNMFIHPTVMFRTEALKIIKEYPYNYPAAEDYAFFFKFVNKLKTANLPEVLVRFEINPNGGISTTRRTMQVKSRIKIILENFNLSYYPIIGLFRNCALLFIPRKLVETIKNYTNWKGK